MLTFCFSSKMLLSAWHVLTNPRILGYCQYSQ